MPIGPAAAYPLQWSGAHDSVHPARWPFGLQRRGCPPAGIQCPSTYRLSARRHSSVGPQQNPNPRPLARAAFDWPLPPMREYRAGSAQRAFSSTHGALKFDCSDPAAPHQPPYPRPQYPEIPPYWVQPGPAVQTNRAVSYGCAGLSSGKTPHQPLPGFYWETGS